MMTENFFVFEILYSFQINFSTVDIIFISLSKDINKHLNIFIRFSGKAIPCHFKII